MEYIRKIHLGDSEDKRDFHYPNYNWFRDTSKNGHPPNLNNSKKTLRRI